MKKILGYIMLTAVFLSFSGIAYAINIGTYKSESEYGLLDGFEFNWRKKERENGKKFIQLREDVYKKRTDNQKQTDMESEYERTRYMYQGEAII